MIQFNKSKGEKKVSEKSKKVGEIFSDYNTNSNIKYAEDNRIECCKKN